MDTGHRYYMRALYRDVVYTDVRIVSPAVVEETVASFSVTSPSEAGVVLSPLPS